MNTAQAVARYLAEAGVRRAFGVPGGELVELIEMFRRNDIQFILTHHEAPAAFMAAATGELSGVPGVCLATRGPGAVNLFGGVATAFVDRRPLIAFTGDHTPAAAKRDTHQQLPLVDLYAPITRLSAQLTAENVGDLLPKALSRSLRPRPGPVFLPFPSAAAERETDWQPTEARPTGAGGADALTDSTDWRALAERVAASRKPLVMTGIGLAGAPGVTPRLVALADRWGCPVMVTPQSKGYFPEDHPSFAGAYGMYRDEPLQALQQAADLIVAIGLDGVDFFKRWQATTPVVSLAGEGAADVTYQPASAVDGPLGALVEALAQARPAGSDWSPDAAAAARAGIEAVVRPKLASAPDGNGVLMPPQAAVGELRRLLPRDGICTTDVGSHKIVAVQQWRAYQPGTFLCSGGLSPMGTGLPFAIAAKLERPEREVACICGDGGLLMYAGELATAVRNGLKLTILLMADQALSSIKVKQVRKDYPLNGVEFDRPDWAALAQGFGFRHTQVARRGDCADALAEALAGPEPTLIEACVDAEEYNTTQ